MCKLLVKQDGCPETCQACVAFTLDLPEQMFQMAHLLMMVMENIGANSY